MEQRIDEPRIIFINGFIVIFNRFVIFIAFEIAIAEAQSRVAQNLIFHVIGANIIVISFDTIHGFLKILLRRRIVFLFQKIIPLNVIRRVNRRLRRQARSCFGNRQKAAHIPRTHIIIFLLIIDITQPIIRNAFRHRIRCIGKRALKIALRAVHIAALHQLHRPISRRFLSRFAQTGRFIARFVDNRQSRVKITRLQQHFRQQILRFAIVFRRLRDGL